jgi:hypothetical protein
MFGFFVCVCLVLVVCVWSCICVSSFFVSLRPQHTHLHTHMHTHTHTHTHMHAHTHTHTHTHTYKHTLTHTYTHTHTYTCTHTRTKRGGAANGSGQIRESKISQKFLYVRALTFFFSPHSLRIFENLPTHDYGSMVNSGAVERKWAELLSRKKSI